MQDRMLVVYLVESIHPALRMAVCSMYVTVCLAVFMHEAGVKGSFNSSIPKICCALRSLLASSKSNSVRVGDPLEGRGK